jgi:hypothetical protein
LFILNTSSWLSNRCLTSVSSTPTSPNSFSITATLSPWLLVRMLLSSVVFPAPRKPVRTVTGTFVSAAAAIAAAAGSNSASDSENSESCTRSSRSAGRGSRLAARPHNGIARLSQRFVTPLLQQRCFLAGALLTLLICTDCDCLFSLAVPCIRSVRGAHELSSWRGCAASGSSACLSTRTSSLVRVLKEPALASVLQLFTCIIHAYIHTIYKYNRTYTYTTCAMSLADFLAFGPHAHWHGHVSHRSPTQFN